MWQEEYDYRVGIYIYILFFWHHSKRHCEMISKPRLASPGFLCFCAVIVFLHCPPVAFFFYLSWQSYPAFRTFAVNASISYTNARCYIFIHFEGWGIVLKNSRMQSWERELPCRMGARNDTIAEAGFRQCHAVIWMSHFGSTGMGQSMSVSRRDGVTKGPGKSGSCSCPVTGPVLRPPYRQAIATLSSPLPASSN